MSIISFSAETFSIIASYCTYESFRRFSSTCRRFRDASMARLAIYTRYHKFVHMKLNSNRMAPPQPGNLPTVDFLAQVIEDPILASLVESIETYPHTNWHDSFQSERLLAPSVPRNRLSRATVQKFDGFIEQFKGMVQWVLKKVSNIEIVLASRFFGEDAQERAEAINEGNEEPAIVLHSHRRSIWHRRQLRLIYLSDYGEHSPIYT